MRVFIPCERSGRVRRAFEKRGHFAVSCDLEPAADGSSRHIVGDARVVIGGGESWDLVIAHPPCRFLSVSGQHWAYRPGGEWRLKEAELALDFFRFFLDLGKKIPKVCVENPVGITSTRIARPSQWIQPYEFGDDASKKTGLWLSGLPLLTKDPRRFVPPRIVIDAGGVARKRWANQTDSGQNRLGPSAERAAIRAETYRGIAETMAEQWG